MPPKAPTVFHFESALGGMISQMIAPSAVSTSPVVGARDLSTGSIAYQFGGSDVDGDTLTYAVTTLPVHGTVSNAGGGALTYAPNTAYYNGLSAGGTDTFSVGISDGHGGSVTQSVAYTWASLTTPTASMAAT